MIMEQEIDYICHECQQPVYKERHDPRAYYAGHRCRTPEEIAEAGKKSTEFSPTLLITKTEWKWTRFQIEPKKLKS